MIDNAQRGDLSRPRLGAREPEKRKRADNASWLKSHECQEQQGFVEGCWGLLLKAKPKQEAKAKKSRKRKRRKKKLKRTQPRESLGVQVKSPESCKLRDSRLSEWRARSERAESLWSHSKVK